MFWRCGCDSQCSSKMRRSSCARPKANDGIRHRPPRETISSTLWVNFRSRTWKENQNPTTSFFLPSILVFFRLPSFFPSSPFSWLFLFICVLLLADESARRTYFRQWAHRVASASQAALRFSDGDPLRERSRLCREYEHRRSLSWTSQHREPKGDKGKMRRLEKERSYYAFLVCTCPAL